ncbi:MAG: hypothetical protein JXB85_16740 [Anaerolineales bacterium]|nr:hypothetical protein [Anaerolineales bacterium]
MPDEIEPRRPIPPAPIHPLAALVTLAFDYVFTIPELFSTLAPPMLLLTSLGIGALGMTVVTLLQRYLASDEWGPAVAKGLLMGILAGVPYPVAGTVVGIPLLAWAGLHQFIRLPGSHVERLSFPKEGATEGEVVDVETE